MDRHKLTCQKCGDTVEVYHEICHCRIECPYCGTPLLDHPDMYAYGGELICHDCATQIAKGKRQCTMCGRWHTHEDICTIAMRDVLCSSACARQNPDDPDNPTYPCGATRRTPPHDMEVRKCWAERGDWHKVLRHAEGEE